MQLSLSSKIVVLPRIEGLKFFLIESIFSCTRALS